MRLLAALLGSLLLPSIALASDESKPARQPNEPRNGAALASLCETRRFGEGCWSAGFHTGYAFPFKFDRADSDIEDSAFVPLFPRLAIGLVGPLGGDDWWRGSIEMGFEGHFLVQTAPHGGSAWGASLLTRYNFLALEDFVPFLEIGGGLIDLDFGLEKRADGLNFALQGGLGLHWLLWKRAAITAQWRYHHISNGRINEPNVAVDSGVVLIGATYFLN